MLGEKLASSADDLVLYVATEEGTSDAVVDRLQRLEIMHPKFLISSSTSWVEINDEVQTVDPCAVVIDSFSVANMEQHQLARLAENLAGPVVFTVHETKDGKAGGDASLAHAVDIVADVTGGVARTTKNRFGALAEMKLWG